MPGSRCFWLLNSLDLFHFRAGNNLVISCIKLFHHFFFFKKNKKKCFQAIEIKTTPKSIPFAYPSMNFAYGVTKTRKKFKEFETLITI